MSSKRPHIVHILGSLVAGGAQRLVFNLVTHPLLQHFQHSVVCILSDQGQFREKFQKAGITIHFCPIRWPTSTPIPSYRINRWLRNHLVFTFHWRFPSLLRRLKADLVHTHLTERIGIQAKAVICRAKLPFIWTIHGLFRSCGEEEPGWLVAFDLIERSERAVITAVSCAALEDVLGERKMPERKARVIYNGIDLSQFEFTYGNDRVKVLRRKWGVPDDAIVFGSAGRLVPVKRFDLLLEAGAEVIKRHPNVHIVIAGDGSMRQALEEQVNKFGLQGRVHLIGYQSDMVQFWREVDVAVISSASEGLPMVLLEACASRIACIATRVGGIPEVLTNDSGVLVEPGSHEGLVEAMEKMLDEKTRLEYSRRARKVAERFSMDKIAAQYNELYQELLQL
ncbi:MAG: glycosyltransferase [Armatimonadetes bacterium]|nr:glycosyltransferase [Armatimonadota bacterium]